MYFQDKFEIIKQSDNFSKDKIEIREVSGKKMLKDFIHLPEKLHAGHKFWTPPIYSDEWKYFNSTKNLSYKYSDVILYLAYSRGNIAGRIMGIINRRFNYIKNERTARFAYLECINEPCVATELLRSIEVWAVLKGMDRVAGPLGFTDQEPEGFLVEGYEHDTTIATYYNFPYVPGFVEMNGYVKEVDYVVYKVPPVIPDIYLKITDRLLSKDYKLIEFQNKKDIKPWIIPILTLMNDSFADIYGYTPLSMEEMADLAKQYLMIIDKRFLKIVVKENNVIGFVLAMPNISEGLRKSRGRLYPFGIFHILHAMKKSKQLDLLLGGIHPKYQKTGVDVLLGTAMINTAIKNGFTVMDSHLELETNLKVRSEMERAGGEVYKRYRVFSKKLNN
jgi:hypothetical protein